MTMKDPGRAQRLERLEEAILRLREAADAATVVVEGARDLAALEALGIGGRHVALHRGASLSEVVEALVAESGRGPVLLLLDWDRTGARLQARLEELLRGRVVLDVASRRLLATSCQSRTVEAVPAELASLRVLGNRQQTP